MEFKTIFSKPIDRRIEGVIYADDAGEEELLNELKEYVLTGEVKDHLLRFLDEYNGNAHNGAWVSGFFGSGKSHLLKILAIVLENRMLCGESAAKIFIDKCAEEPLLKGALEKAVSLPSKSVLFNIDRKADASGLHEKDNVILPIFLKVFNEICGYCPDRPAIADFERKLDEDGQLAAFQLAFSEMTGFDWKEVGWTRTQRFEKQIDAAYQKATGSSATAVIKSSTQGFECSVDDFAKMVKTYIGRQEPGFKLNFFVDEVGQFVADNVKLMLNLQSVAEALNSACKKQSWLIVTSQSDVDMVTGEMTKAGGDSFSRIMDRFKIKMPLSSVNAGEVIRLRLLKKTPESVPEIAAAFAEQGANMKTMYDFVDGSKKYRFFEGERDFVDTYPLVPYQFFLFREAMLHLSRHDAFTSRFQSVGERSTLNVCQRVLLRMDAERLPVGTMAPFDYWYDGIAESIKSEVRGQIGVAEKNLELPDGLKPLAIRILKALLLVKYLTADFKPTVRNITSLLVTDLTVNFSQLLADLEKALGFLVSQSYVQCVAECYEYLTDSEKDLDKEIKAATFSDSDIVDVMKKVLFSQVVKTRKIVWKDQPYAFTQMLDGAVVSRADGDLSVNFITPYNPDGGDLMRLQANALGRDELTLVMGSDPQLMREIQSYLQTENFLRVNPPIQEQNPARKRLLQSRQDGQSAAMSTIEARIKELVAAGTVLVRGVNTPVGSTNATDRVIEGFASLATQVYSSLPIVAGMMSYSDADVPRFLKKDETLPGIDLESEAEREVMSFMRLNQQGGTRTTLRGVVAHFCAKPYGWPQGVVQCLVAKLLANGKVEMSAGGGVIAVSDYRATLTNTRNFDMIVLEPQVDVTPAQVAALKKFAGDFFSEPVSQSDAKAVSAAVMQKFKDELAVWSGCVQARSAFPFVAALDPALAKARLLVVQKDMSLYDAAFVDSQAEWLDLRDDPIDPVVALMAGEQKKIFERAWNFALDNRPNFLHLLSGGLSGDMKAHWEKLLELLKSPTVYKAGGITQIRALHETLKTELATAVSEARKTAKAVIEGCRATIEGMDEYAAAPQAKKDRVASAVASALSAIEADGLISSIRDFARTFKDHVYMQLVNEILTSDVKPNPMQPNEKPTDQRAGKVVEFKRATQGYAKALLSSSDDLDAYLGYLREKLGAEIAAGRKVIL